MFKRKHVPILSFVLIVGIFYSWSWLFKGNDWLVSIGVIVLQIAVGIISLVWLIQAYRHEKRHEKAFWLLLSIGLAIYLSSNLLWLYAQIREGTVVYEENSYIAWLGAYLFFMSALFVKTRKVSASIYDNPHTFNIVIVMITVTTVILHFLINPVLVMAENSWLVTIITVIYPIVDLTILFIITVLYYLIQNNKAEKYMLFCVTGFSCQIAADLLYSYFAYTETYQPGNIVDLFWVLAIFFIGITGFYAIDHKNEAKLGVPNPLGNKDVLIPYTSILLLLFLVIDSYNWDFNILSVGLLVAFFIVLGRQFQILYKNRKLTNQFRHLAYHDPLTGLNNRGSFIEKIEAVLENSRDGKVALLLIDLDRFKVVNDTLGHHVGDEVLVKTAERLKKSLTADALLFRIGGDEFTIVLARATEAKCVALAENILTAFQPPMFSEDHEINITPSIGISIFPAHGITSEELMKNADAAMYLSKENGKNSFSFYNAELDKVMMRKLQIENDLKTAISNEQLSLVYQPKVDLQSKKVVGMEALLRWNHPQLGWISPLEFIPIAEETRQIIPIGEWVLNEACRQNKQWQEQGYPPLCVSVNVSVLQFQHGEFLETVQKALQTSQLDAQFLELEITESMMQDIKESKDILDSLMKEGVKTSIDDFGTGYSSLSVLPKLPIDTIKIDKSFMDELEKTGQYSIVKTIIDLSQNLNLKVVAEGIETESQRQILRENGCLVGQGYLFYKPVAPNDFESILKEAALKGDQDEIPLLGDFVQQKAILQK